MHRLSLLNVQIIEQFMKCLTSPSVCCNTRKYFTKVIINCIITYDLFNKGVIILLTYVLH